MGASRPFREAVKCGAERIAPSGGPGAWPIPCSAEHDRDGPVVDELDRHPRPEHSRCDLDSCGGAGWGSSGRGVLRRLVVASHVRRDLAAGGLGSNRPRSRDVLASRSGRRTRARTRLAGSVPRHNGGPSGRAPSRRRGGDRQDHTVEARRRRRPDTVVSRARQPAGRFGDTARLRRAGRPAGRRPDRSDGGSARTAEARARGGTAPQGGRRPRAASARGRAGPPRSRALAVREQTGPPGRRRRPVARPTVGKCARVRRPPSQRGADRTAGRPPARGWKRAPR